MISRHRLCARFSWKKPAAGSVSVDLEKGHDFTLNDDGQDGSKLSLRVVTATTACAPSRSAPIPPVACGARLPLFMMRAAHGKEF